MRALDASILTRAAQDQAQAPRVLAAKLDVTASQLIAELQRGKPGLALAEELDRVLVAAGAANWTLRTKISQLTMSKQGV